jgi:membrane-associated phospholipid phosphatase
MPSHIMQRLLELDARLTNRLRLSEQPGPARTVAALLAHSGDSWFWGLGLLLLWLLGNTAWKQLAVTMFLAIAGTAVIVLALKFTIRRRRPSGEWGGIYRRTDPHSFPSGHAARAFMLAVLGLGLGPAWLGTLLAVWAPLVCLARVAMGVHYFSDVAAGCLLGLFTGWVTLQL